MSERPTENASQHYNEAASISRQMTPDKSDNELIRYLGWILREIAFGNQELATGLRATYIMLERVDQRLTRLEQSRR
jgi:hypothetical protein